MILGFLAIVAVTAAAASIAWNLTTPSSPKPAPTAPTASTPSPAPASRGSTAGSPTTATSTATSASASSPSGPSKPAPIPDDEAKCFESLLPKNAFGRYEPKLDKACSKKYAYDAMLVVKTAIVRAGGSYTVTPAMQEWSNMGWFETAAFAAMRAHCCPDAPALKAPKRQAMCKMEEALAYITNAIDDEKEMKDALKKFYEGARCVARRGGGPAWGRFDAPYGGEEKYFDKIYQRIRKARGK
jgi:serine/threonine-protein kinase